ncbi:hypothetical protein KC19_8G009100 [Ceratodon purpureus]|uniref:Amidase domain-containing protein n=1 Tax=Ceratodon purpureus TaxID=3225 RepID=A0A8T0H225_CERPU|nr:hypothetical protein KC19_8G009100 [Ceratodon purpureus]
MPERVETHVSPVVAARVHRIPCRPAPPQPPPPPSRFPALDWQRISFGLPRRKIILLGLSVVGIAGIYVLVKNGKLTFSDLPDFPDMPDLPTLRLPNLPSLRLPNLPSWRQLFVRKLQPAESEEEPEKPAALDLAQCKFGYQDVFDVESAITGFGSYDWEQTHTPATQTAVTISLILNAGAVSTGKQSMDEFGLSLFGRNKRDGDAENPVAPKHFAGGAACGSGVAVASNAIDFALAIDTMGGVRIPAAFCGIYGFRASHGVISTAGIIPVAPSLDVVGVLARDPYILHTVAKVLLQQPELEWGLPSAVLVADDCFGMSTISSVRTADLLSRAVTDTLGLSLVKHVNLGTHLASNVPTLRNFLMEEERLLKQDTSRYTTYDGLRDAMLLILRGEFKEKHRKWFKEVDPELPPDVDVRVKFAMAPHLDGLHRMALKVKDETRAVINELLLMDALLVLPSTPSLPPIKTAKGKELEIFESRALSMLSIATMAGCCQIIKQKKPIVKDEDVIPRNSVNERDVPARRSNNRTSKGERAGSRAQRDGSGSRAQAFQDNKENNQPSGK